MEQSLFVVNYRKGAVTQRSVPMTRRVAEKQADLLQKNGYEIEITPYDARAHLQEVQ